MYTVTDKHQRSRSSRSSRYTPCCRARSQRSSSASLNGARAFPGNKLKNNHLPNQQAVRHWHNRGSKEYLHTRGPNSNLQFSESRSSMLSRNHSCGRCSSSLLV
jgi:hypothetical protein